MFKIDRCSMYPGSLPLIFNGSVPGHEKLFNVRRCSMYTGVQFGRFHYIYIYISVSASVLRATAFTLGSGVMYGLYSKVLGPRPQVSNIRKHN